MSGSSNMSKSHASLPGIEDVYQAGRCVNTFLMISCSIVFQDRDLNRRNFCLRSSSRVKRHPIICKICGSHMPVWAKGKRWWYITFIGAVVLLLLAGGSSCRIYYNDQILLCAGWGFNALSRHSLRSSLLLDGFHWLGSRLLIDGLHWRGFCRRLGSRLLINGFHWRGVCRRLGSRLLIDGFHWRSVCRRLGSRLLIDGFHWRRFCHRLLKQGRHRNFRRFSIAFFTAASLEFWFWPWTVLPV
jgi:hypothetical protein